MAQQGYDCGPHKNFVKEEPELNKIEIARPFVVTRIEGTVLYPAGSPLSQVFFEIRDSSGQVRSSVTDDKGVFRIPNVPPGTYVFKATKNNFHSVIGTVAVSPKAPRKNKIRIQLQLGT